MVTLVWSVAIGAGEYQRLDNVAQRRLTYVDCYL